MAREKGVEVHAENAIFCGGDAAMDDDVVDEIMGALSEAEIWLGGDEQDETPVADSSIFDNSFPPLPDFPCMSSTSSSSSTPALTTKQFVSSSASPASSSSSAASWAMIRSDADQRMKQDVRSIQYDPATPVPDLSDGFRPSDGSTGMEDVDCMDVMNNFGYMDLIDIEDGNDLWDPSCIFQSDDDQTYSRDQSIVSQDVRNREDENCYIIEGGKEVKEKTGFDELGVMFFEWLKNNKEHISAEDMRNIKFKRATIECASKRLGSTQEGRKQLLKLILEWVEQHHLQNKRNQDAAAAAHQVVPCQYQESFPNPNPNIQNTIPTMDANTFMWIPTQTYFNQALVSPAASAPAVFPPPAMAYVVGDLQQQPFVGGANASPMNCQAYSPQMPMPPTGYHLLQPAQSWPQSQFVSAPQYNSFPDQNGTFAPITPQPFAPVYGDQNPSQIYNGNNVEDPIRLGPSATKEARKKRMARQRRVSLHHYRHHPHQNQLKKVDSSGQNEGRFNIETCTDNIDGVTSPLNCILQPPAIESPILEQPHKEAQPRQQECHTSDRTLLRAQSNQQLTQTSERGQQLQKQEFKGGNNFKLLLQKVLKQSDVGNLGRIVLPKKEAETHLPQLDERDGISIDMEDIGISKVWNLRYSLRFWPNNKSRMYLLENTGDFVRTNGLQEGDFIVIYSDMKNGKYLIRGVKVRQQPAKPKSEPKVKATRKNRNSGAGNGHSSTPSKLKGK
ncbi:B3 domain-containing transcription factor ABI3 isoform X1 [Daucus carota subsp. sativus]|uniref:B3 domain-containing transcription factor ABI3 isoform X1 n=1 Tax=Daucus carota subsp. sativus TaxID=79200 RepID=UPI0007EFBC6B|nr:PREDICTED: B3 domain-containing transcription factor ABI3 isoform X1 [Daucus carota subsp. sativus]XP_017219002.1 PREDICTED: B3 domain-containing transcription factor ABI3 isoform X1 [Daucus carota subsp. sativus]